MVLKLILCLMVATAYTSNVTIKTLPEEAIAKCISTIMKQSNAEVNYFHLANYRLSHLLSHADIMNGNVAVGVGVNADIKANGKVDTYVVIFEEIIELKFFLAKVKWDGKTKFLLVYLGAEEIGDLFELCWHYFITKVVVVTANHEVYEYHPIHERNCGGNTTHLISRDCTDAFVFNHEITHFFNCTIRVLPFRIAPYINPEGDREPGYELILLNELSLRLNFTVSFVAHHENHWGYKEGSGVYSKMYKMLYNRKADLMVGVIFANESFFDDFSPLRSHTQAYLAFYTPTARLMNSWQTFVLVFDAKLWAAFAASALCATVVWWMIGTTRSYPEGYDSIISCGLKIWCVIFSTFSAQPKSILLRNMFALWSTYCFIISCTYQSSLISYLTNPLYEHQISTIKELINSDLHYGGYSTARELFHLSKNEEYQQVYKNWYFCPVTEECINRTAQKRDFAVYKNTRQVSYLTPRYYIGEDGRPNLYQFKETFLFFIWMVLLKNFPLYDRMNAMTLGIQEAGLLAKWDGDVQYKPPEFESAGNLIPLNLGHLKLAFVVLVVGLTLSTLCFLSEFIVKKKN